MNPATQARLATLRINYEENTGRPFKHFYCPILARDEDVELCQAHIVNEAFPASSRKWTVQRKDVDGFYGSIFEGEFVKLQYRGKFKPNQVLADLELSKKLRPHILIEGEPVEHFIAQGPVPSKFTEILVEGGDNPVRLGIKLTPSETLAALEKNWGVKVAGDLRLPALVSILKSAHLTMFELLGYRYALSAGGLFVGKTILGDFFLQNQGNRKADILAAAESHFREFANLVRPVQSESFGVTGTIDDRYLFICGTGHTHWALIIFVRTGKSLNAVLIPTLENVDGAARFAAFLRSDDGPILGSLAQLDTEQWSVSPISVTLNWPPARYDL